jgi:KDO2-lipid IV(A) lauroyltransferase
MRPLTLFMHDKLYYYLIRAITFPLTLLPLSWIHILGALIGKLAYHLLTGYRKRTLSNLALAKDLSLSEKEMKKIGKESFQNLAITCLEYGKFSKIKKTQNLWVCENPEKAKSLIDSGKGIIFFCGHQANWEVLFLEGTQRMPGVAVGRPIKNLYLYKWIIKMRSRYGGKVITPKETIKEGLRGLKQGKFLGIVGDQAMPESAYSFSFFGRRAWTSIAPALLAYKTKSPIIVATLKRERGMYKIHYSDPIWPQPEIPMEKEVQRLTKKSLYLLEEKIRETPGQWLWQHNRWKQETPDNVYYRYRLDSILIILPKDPSPYLDHLKTFREIYPKAFISILTPQRLCFEEGEILLYEKESELYLKDYRFKLVFNFSGKDALKHHFLKLSAFKVLNISDLSRAANEHLKGKEDLSLLLKKALCRPNTLWKKDVS